MARQYRISTSIEFFGSKFAGRIFAREKATSFTEGFSFSKLTGRNPGNEAARIAIQCSFFDSYFVGRLSIPGRFRNIIDLPVLYFQHVYLIPKLLSISFRSPWAPVSFYSEEQRGYGRCGWCFPEHYANFKFQQKN